MSKAPDPRQLRKQLAQQPQPQKFTTYWWYRGVPETRAGGPWHAKEFDTQQEAEYHAVAMFRRDEIYRTVAVPGRTRYTGDNIDPEGKEST